jgi:hypothetical protein
MKRWKNTKNIGKHFISDIAEAGAENNKMIFILNSILTQGTNPVVNISFIMSSQFNHKFTMIACTRIMKHFLEANV